MLIAVWSVKGGSGVTVVSACLALTVARISPVLLVDLAGDLPAALGLPEPDTPGINEWLTSGVEAPASALARMEVDVGPNLCLLPMGRDVIDRDLESDRGAMTSLRSVLMSDRRTVIADCGQLTKRPVADRGAFQLALGVAGAATTSLLVVRPCYLALRHAARAPLTPTGVVVVRDAMRALGPQDVTGVVGVPAVAVVDIDPAVARVVDAGLLAARLPRGMAGALRSIA